MEKTLKTFLSKLKADKKTLMIASLGLIGVLLLAFSGAKGEKTVSPGREEAYDVTRLEAELTSLLKSVDGVGKVRVMITCEDLGRSVYAKNHEEKQTGSADEREDEFVLTDGGGLLIGTVLPEVRGVGVCCEGGGSAVIRREVSELVAAALGIPINRVKVAKMKSGRAPAN